MSGLQITILEKAGLWYFQINGERKGGPYPDFREAAQALKVQGPAIITEWLKDTDQKIWVDLDDDFDGR